DLDGKILCSSAGSKPAQRIKEEIPAVQLQEYDTTSSCIEALSQGNVDAMTSDAPILAGFAGQYDGEFEVLDMTKSDGSHFSNEWYGIGLQKGDTAGVEAVNNVLTEMQDSGQLDEILNEYFGDLDSIEEATPGDLSEIQYPPDLRNCMSPIAHRILAHRAASLRPPLGVVPPGAVSLALGEPDFS